MDKCLSAGCGNRPCSNGLCLECQNDNHCKNGFQCVNNICTDKCSLIKCPFGRICRNGQCHQELKPHCRYDNDCTHGLKCISG